MSYVTRAEIETEVPAGHLADALDDDRDGAEDAGLFDALVAQAAQAVDALLSGTYTVPFLDPAPPPVREAAFAFLGERIYARREMAEKNPFSERAKYWRERLALAGQGKLPLSAGEARLVPPGVAVVNTAEVNGTML
jgi:hypothetical protein